MIPWPESSIAPVDEGEFAIVTQEKVGRRQVAVEEGLRSCRQVRRPAR